MKTYYSTFIPGLLEPIRDALLAELPQTRILTILDGLILYQSKAPTAAIQKLPFFTNSFYVLKAFTGDSAKSVESIASHVLHDRVLSCPIPFPHSQNSTFRVVVSRASELVAVSSALMKQMEAWIKIRTGLRPDRSKPDIQFWLLQRTEGYGFFSIRLTKHRAYDKILSKGELRPELANILCHLSDPKAHELFLDPFCGSGAIPIQRAKHFPRGLVISSDNDQRAIESLKQRVTALGLKKRLVVRHDDALHLTRYEQGSIHKIVTDPPWGHFAITQLPLETFYQKMMAEFARILRLGGRLVLLVGTNAVLDTIIRAQQAMTQLHRYNILLSGKKATVYVLTRE